MKFLAQILAGLKTKYANLGFSEQVLTGVATFLAANVTEENQVEGVITSAEALLKPFQSDLDASRNAKVEAEKKLKELESKGGGKGDKNPNPNPKEEPKNDEQPEWVKQMLKNMEAMSQEISGMKLEKVSGLRIQQVKEVVKNLPAEFQAPYLAVDYASLKDDDFNSKLETMKTGVQGAVALLQSKGVSFTPPGGGSGNPQASEASDAEVAEVTAQMGI